MKKVLCAAALAAIIAPIGTTYAVPLYDKDGLSYDLSGDFNLWLHQKPGKDKDFDVQFDDFIIGNAVEYDLGNGLTAFGELNFNAVDAANDSEVDTIQLEDAFLGISFDTYSLLFGLTGSAADDFGVVGAYESPLGDHAFDAFTTTDGDDLIKFQATIADLVNIIAAYEIEAESEDSDENGEFFDVLASLDIAGFNVAVAYQNFDPIDELDEETGLTIKTDDVDVYGFQLSYDAEVVQIAADYSVYDAENDEGADFYNVYIAVPISSVTLAGGWQMIDYDKETDEHESEVNGWYANITYAFPEQDNVSVYFEVEGTDEDDTDPGYLLGMSIGF